MVLGEVVFQVGQQLGELLGEIVGRGLAAVALQGERRQRVGAGGAAEAEVDPPRKQRGEDREGLRHLERAVVGQHDAARTDADAVGGGGDRPDQDLGAGTGQHRTAVVLGDPVAMKAKRIGEARQVELLCSAWAPVEPSEIGDWSRTERSMSLMLERPKCR